MSPAPTIALVLLLLASACTTAADRQEQLRQRLTCLTSAAATTDRERREAAVEDIGKIGPPAASAVPTLAAVLEDPKADSELRVVVLEALGRIGPAAAPVIPAIVAANARDPGLQTAAQDALQKIDSPSAAALIDVLSKSPDTSARIQAAQLLGGDRSKASAQALLRALRSDPNGDVRRAAAKRLGELRLAEALPSLARALHDAHWPCAAEAARALVRLGRDGKAELRRALTADKVTVSLAAAGALENLDASATAVLPAWLTATKDSRAPLRAAAAAAIGKLGPAAGDEGRAALETLLLDPEIDVQQAAELGLLRLERGD